MTTNLNETFAAVQAASRELALLLPLPKQPSFFQRMRRTWHGWIKVIRNTTG